jgi:hypothetical protein
MPSSEEFFPTCDCFDQYRSGQQHAATRFHAETQDVECDGWKRLLELVEQAAADGRKELFLPANDIPVEERRQIVSLPPTIAKLKSVTRLVMYHTWLVRIPPEIGEMESLERFEPYWSHCLHWFPYELTRCSNLKSTCVSTRSLYGNFKIRPPFPELRPPVASTTGLDLDNLSPGSFGADRIVACSVCGTSLRKTGLVQVWISAYVGTDVWPLLVNACSEMCVRQLPQGAADHVATPHRGGLNVWQPPPSFGLR